MAKQKTIKWKDISDINENKKFYQFKNLWDSECDIGLLYGQKSNGKTTTVLQAVLTACYRNGLQMALVRRWSEDFAKGRAQTIFSEICSRGFIRKMSTEQWTDLYYRNHAWYLCYYNDKDERICADEPLVYARSLTDYEHDNGNQFPNVHFIVFDEFLTAMNELPSEFIRFMKVYSNLRRQKEYFRCFMLGNTVDMYSSYWDNMGITNIRKQKEGTIDVYEDEYNGKKVKICAEYCPNIVDNKYNSVIGMFEKNNPKLRMITSGGWELGKWNCPPEYRPCEISYKFFIKFYENTMAVDCVIQDNAYFLAVYPFTKEIKNIDNTIIYTNEYKPQMNYRRNIVDSSDKLGKFIAMCLKQDKLFFANAVCGNAFNKFVDWCKTGHEDD